MKEFEYSYGLIKNLPFTPKHLGDTSASSKTETFHALINISP